MSIFCPKCHEEWKEDMNNEKIDANGIQCVYCNTFFVDLSFIKQILLENKINLDLRNIGDKNGN